MGLPHGRVDGLVPEGKMFEFCRVTSGTGPSMHASPEARGLPTRAPTVFQLLTTVKQAKGGKSHKAELVSLPSPRPAQHASPCEILRTDAAEEEVRDVIICEDSDGNEARGQTPEASAVPTHGLHLHGQTWLATTVSISPSQENESADLESTLPSQSTQPTTPICVAAHQTVEGSNTQGTQGFSIQAAQLHADNPNACYSTAQFNQEEDLELRAVRLAEETARRALQKRARPSSERNGKADTAWSRRQRVKKDTTVLQTQDAGVKSTRCQEEQSNSTQFDNEKMPEELSRHDEHLFQPHIPAVWPPAADRRRKFTIACGLPVRLMSPIDDTAPVQSDRPASGMQPQISEPSRGDHGCDEQNRDKSDATQTLQVCVVIPTETLALSRSSLLSAFSNGPIRGFLEDDDDTVLDLTDLLSGQAFRHSVAACVLRTAGGCNCSIPADKLLDAVAAADFLGAERIALNFLAQVSTQRRCELAMR